jgi:hypothetical protein
LQAFVDDVKELEAYVKSELNCKSVRFTTTLAEYVTPKALPNRKALGTRLNKKARDVIKVRRVLWFFFVFFSLLSYESNVYSSSFVHNEYYAFFITSIFVTQAMQNMDKAQFAELQSTGALTSTTTIHSFVVLFHSPSTLLCTTIQAVQNMDEAQFTELQSTGALTLCGEQISMADVDIEYELRSGTYSNRHVILHTLFSC